MRTTARRPRITSALVGAGAITVSSVAVEAPPVVHAITCSTGNKVSSTAFRTASQGQDHARLMHTEGYHNGTYWDLWTPGGDMGTCFYNDNDGGGPTNPPDSYDGNGDPLWIGHDREEGLDCSGFVMKAWYLPENYLTTHGWATRYFSNAYRTNLNISSGTWMNNQDTANWTGVAWKDRGNMDAIARYGHVVLVYGVNADGTHTTMEAQGHWGVGGAKETGYYYNRSFDDTNHDAFNRDGW